MERKYIWHTIVLMLLFHIWTLIAIFGSGIYVAYNGPWTVLWVGPVLAFVMWQLQSTLGTGIGFHRLLTHEGFKTSWWMKAIFILFGCLSAQGPPIRWIVLHRLHHCFTDGPQDPHSPAEKEGWRGLAWAHLEWMLVTHPEWDNEVMYNKYGKKLLQDRLLLFFDRFWWLPSLVFGLVVFSSLAFVFQCSWTESVLMMLWAVPVPVTIQWHFTWMVNSVTHSRGDQPHDTGDLSTNHRLTAWVTAGEGWHNNHHKFPRSAQHGLEEGQVDWNWTIIKWMEKKNLISDVYTAAK